MLTHGTPFPRLSGRIDWLPVYSTSWKSGRNATIEHLDISVLEAPAPEACAGKQSALTKMSILAVRTVGSLPNIHWPPLIKAGGCRICLFPGDPSLTGTTSVSGENPNTWISRDFTNSLVGRDFWFKRDPLNKGNHWYIWEITVNKEFSVSIPRTLSIRAVERWFDSFEDLLRFRNYHHFKDGVEKIDKLDPPSTLAFFDLNSSDHAESFSIRCFKNVVESLCEYIRMVLMQFLPVAVVMYFNVFCPCMKDGILG